MGESRGLVGHPSPFPVELPRRCIKLFSFVDDMVLDPFVGSGSTLIACIENNRKGIGIDIDKNYCEIARQRLLKGKPTQQLRLKWEEGKQSMEYFEAHPYEELRHGPVVDWVMGKYQELYGKSPRDPWRAIRGLHQEKIRL